MSMLAAVMSDPLVPQVRFYSATMSKWIKSGNYNHDYHHKQSKYVVQDYSRYPVQLKDDDSLAS